MNGNLKKAGLAVAMAATTLTIAAPAEAQRYDRYRNRGGNDVAAGAIIGGIVGLGLGAAIASSNNRGRYYDRGYYGDGYYAQPPRRFYRQRYQGPRGYYRGYDRGYDRGYYNAPRGYYDQPRGYYGY